MPANIGDYPEFALQRRKGMLRFRSTRRPGRNFCGNMPALGYGRYMIKIQVCKPRRLCGSGSSLTNRPHRYALIVYEQSRTPIGVVNGDLSSEEVR